MFLPKYLYGKDYKKSAFAKYVNPENKELLKALPPCFLVSSRGDNLRKYTLNFYKALGKPVNTKSELLYFKKDKKLTHRIQCF